MAPLNQPGSVLDDRVCDQEMLASLTKCIEQAIFLRGGWNAIQWGSMRHETQRDPMYPVEDVFTSVQNQF